VKKFIFIPVVNNFDLLEKALRSVDSNLYNEYLIYNNSGGEIPYEYYMNTPFKIWDPIIPDTFMETQNNMREYAINNNFDYYSFMHNDGEILDDSDIRMIEYVESLEDSWGIVFTHYDVFCSFNTKAVKEIGPWGDESWPMQKSGYFLDCDYYRRLKLAGFLEKNLENSNVSHFASNTIKDENQRAIWVEQYNSILNHYIKKWGGDTGKEIYDIPFNGGING